MLVAHFRIALVRNFQVYDRNKVVERIMLYDIGLQSCNKLNHFSCTVDGWLRLEGFTSYVALS